MANTNTRIDLPLAASSGGTVSLSGAVGLTGSLSIFGTQAFSVRAVEQHLILSSSAGSIVYVSGALLADGNLRVGSLTPASAGGAIAGNSSNVIVRTAGTVAGLAGNAFNFQDTNGNTGPYVFAGGFAQRNTGLVAWAAGAGASPGVTYDLTLGRNAAGVLQMSSSAAGTTVLASQVGHLILSSSIGSVVAVSGTLKFGTYAAVGAESIQGYVTILDSEGNTRKIAVISDAG